MTAVKRYLEGISFPRVLFGESLFGNVDVNFEAEVVENSPFSPAKEKY